MVCPAEQDQAGSEITNCGEDPREGLDPAIRVIGPWRRHHDFDLPVHGVVCGEGLGNARFLRRGPGRLKGLPGPHGRITVSQSVGAEGLVRAPRGAAELVD